MTSTSSSPAPASRLLRARSTATATGAVVAGLFAGLALAAACTAGGDESPATGSDADARRDGTSADGDAGGTGVTGPTRLSETGLYSDFASRTVAPGIVAYAPRYEFWADGASKSRWLWLPPGTTIDTTRMDHWVFPIGTKIWKEFRAGGKVVETRLLMKVAEGNPDGWWMAPYVWNDDGSDAVAELDGVTNAVGTTHDVPAQTDCINCHQNVKDVALGVSAFELSGVGPAGLVADAGGEDAARDGGDAGAGASWLATFAAQGKLSSSPPGDYEVPGTGVVKSALAYLHVNCGGCHNDEAVRLATQTKLRLRLLVSQTAPEETGAYTTSRGLVMKHPLANGTVTEVLVPGDPDHSGMWVRMGLRDFYAMPPVGTKLVDDTGRETIRQWIAGLPP